MPGVCAAAARGFGVKALVSTCRSRVQRNARLLWGGQFHRTAAQPSHAAGVAFGRTRESAMGGARNATSIHFRARSHRPLRALPWSSALLTALLLLPCSRAHAALSSEAATVESLKKLSLDQLF